MTKKKVNKKNYTKYVIDQLVKDVFAGRPKKELCDVKKNRCVRVSDKDIDLIKSSVKSDIGLSLQSFLDWKIEELKNKKRK